MKICDDACLINALHVVEVTINNTVSYVKGSGEQRKGIVMSATYALAIGDPKNQSIQSTHGKCTATPQNWSKETLEKLADLIDSMENDLLPRHFDVMPKTEQVLNILQEKNDDETRTETGRLEETPQI
jgi:hypothetical protein